MTFSSFDFLSPSKTILVFGSNGQVGRALQMHFKNLKLPVIFLDRSDCDLANELSVKGALSRYQPQVIINAAAYTSVDKAERLDQREIVFTINAIAPKIMAEYVAGVTHGVLVHYSTDYVFTDSKGVAYQESDAIEPNCQSSVYGQSKIAGELAIKEAFNFKNSGDLNESRYFILRTSWVYGDGCNFVRTILHLAGERNQLKVVADQIGVPTAAQWLAEVSIRIAGSDLKSGVYHTVPDGEVSWYGLALFAIEAAASLGKSIKVKSEDILPIPAIYYPSIATRPYNSRLDNQKFKKVFSKIGFKGGYPHWCEQVKSYIKQVVNGVSGS